MDFEYPPELAAFQAEVRAFFAEEMAPARTRGRRDPRDRTGWSEDFERALQRRAGERGYLGIGVPREYGGGGRPPSYKAVFGFEAAYRDAPAIDTALTLVGPQILGYADERQRERYLPRMLAGDVLMCSAYTEPEAGSDLARIRTRARREGDGFALDGVKALVTGAHKSEYCCLVARTDPDAPAREGLSMFLVDLGGPGIRVERRETMNRWTLGEIRFEDARVPGDALLGEWNRGWPQMAGALLAERSGMVHLGWATRHLELLCEHVRDTGLGRRGAVRERLAVLRCELATGLHFSKRVMWRQDRGELPAHEASMAKVWATELLQRIAHLGLELLGPEGTLYRGSPAAPFDGLFAWEAIERVHPTLSAGTNELQRDTIARAGLRLPGDP